MTICHDAGRLVPLSFFGRHHGGHMVTSWLKYELTAETRAPCPCPYEPPRSGHITRLYGLDLLMTDQIQKCSPNTYDMVFTVLVHGRWGFIPCSVYSSFRISGTTAEAIQLRHTMFSAGAYQRCNAFSCMAGYYVPIPTYISES